MEKAKFFGVKSFSNGGYIIYHEFNTHTKESKVQNIKTCRKILNNKNTPASKIRHIQQQINHKLIGGVIGFNKKQLILMKNKIQFPNGSEYKAYALAELAKGIPTGICDFWINIKVKNNELHSFNSMMNSYQCEDLKLTKEIEDLFNLIYSL